MKNTNKTDNADKNNTYEKFALDNTEKITKENFFKAVSQNIADKK